MEHVQILLLGPAAGKRPKFNINSADASISPGRKEKPIFKIFHISPSFYFQARYIPALKTASKKGGGGTKEQ